MPVPQSVRGRLSRYLEKVHGTCTDNHCDIGIAMKCGYTLWAARMLDGATETPKWFTACVGDIPEEDLEEERKALLQEDHFKCEGCGALVWKIESTDSEVCDNCGEAKAPEPAEEDGEADT